MNQIKSYDTKDVHMLDIVIYISTLVVTSFFLLGIDYSGTDIRVVLSFLAIGLYSFISIIRPGRCISIFKSVFIFNYIFFFMAGLQCYCSGTILWSSTDLSIYYTTADYLKANAMILLMSACFDFTYSYTKSKTKEKTVTVKDESDNRDNMMSDAALNTLFIINIVSFTILIITNNVVSEEHITKIFSLDTQLRNILTYIPVVSFILCYIYRRKSIITHNKFFLAFVIVEISVLFSPFINDRPRFFLLGTYIVLLTLFFSGIKYKSLYWGLLFFGFCFAFTNLKEYSSLSDTLFSSIDFVYYDFDAHQLLMAIIKYTEMTGICYGMNILSALAFIIPRTFWTGKMESTGGIVVSAFGSGQTNVSSPLVGEAYFAFSWLGVALLGLLLGFVIQKVDSWYHSENGFLHGAYCIVVGMSIYILRGSLLSTMAYTLGLLLALAFAYCVVYFLKKF